MMYNFLTKYYTTFYSQIDNRYKISFGLLGFSAFLIANIPSLKLILPSSYITNISFMVFLISVVSWRIYRGQEPNVDNSIFLLVLLMVVSISLMILPTTFKLSEGPSLSYPIGIIYVVIAAVTVYAFTDQSDIVAFVYSQFVWSVTLALLYLSAVIGYSSELGQHYNTVAVPVTLGFLIAILYIFYNKNIMSIILMFLSILLLICLFSLGGRGPFIGIPLVLCALAFPYLMTLRQWPWKQLLIVSTVFGFIVAAVGSIIRVSSYEPSSLLIHRIRRTVEDPTSESRIGIYTSTMEEVLKNPIGNGLGMYPTTGIAPYPHNIILHATYAGGWIAGLLIMIVILASYRELLLKATIVDFYGASLMAISIYMLFIFSISYSIHHSYMLFIPLFLALSVCQDQE